MKKKEYIHLDYIYKGYRITGWTTPNLFQYYKVAGKTHYTLREAKMYVNELIKNKCIN